MFRLKYSFSESEKALGGTARQYGDLISGIDKENAKNQHSYQKLWD